MADESGAPDMSAECAQICVPVQAINCTSDYDFCGIPHSLYGVGARRFRAELLFANSPGEQLKEKHNRLVFVDNRLAFVNNLLEG